MYSHIHTEPKKLLEKKCIFFVSMFFAEVVSSIYGRERVGGGSDVWWTDRRRAFPSQAARVEFAKNIIRCIIHLILLQL
jgi:hypothetical protein